MDKNKAINKVTIASGQPTEGVVMFRNRGAGARIPKDEAKTPQ